MDWKTNKRIKVLFGIIWLGVFPLQGQQADTLLNRYINIGLQNNLALQQKNADYKKSLKALDEARSWFFPALSFNARYSLAEGGRTIEFPVGDMLNPVYNTLNYLTNTHLFPNIENQTFNFLRPHEHETKVELVQPLFNPDILYNYKIRKELTGYWEANRNAYRRALISDIKKAYYTYLKMVRIDELVKSTRTLLEANVRLNEKLFRNQKITIDVVYRSRSELSRFEQNAAEAGKNLQAAKAYFNFLLNRPLNRDIIVPDTLSVVAVIPDREQDKQLALRKREEINQLDYGLRSADYQIKLQKNDRLPVVFAAVDYGFQGEKYIFDKTHDFTLASFVLRWDLFQGMQKKAKISESRIEKDKLEARKTELKQQICLQVDNAWNGLIAAQKAMKAADEEEKAANKAFRVMSKKYEQGMANYLEFLDSRTNMTEAKLRKIIARYDYLIIYAEYERVTATYLTK